jgi:hypothetical protein
VPFKKYVITVMGKEWPGYLPHSVIEAGAVAVKQFAWYHALGRGRVSRSGQCFDVTDGIGDQLYKPNRSRIRSDHYSAVDATWGVRLLKHGSLFMTGYRTGNKGACGHDATGWKLYARSATRCAGRGMGYLQILRIYYGPGLTIVNGGGAGGGTDPSQDVVVSSDESGSDQATSLAQGGGVLPSAPALDATFVVPHQAVMDVEFVDLAQRATIDTDRASAERPFALV